MLFCISSKNWYFINLQQDKTYTLISLSACMFIWIELSNSKLAYRYFEIMRHNKKIRTTVANLQLIPLSASIIRYSTTSILKYNDELAESLQFDKSVVNIRNVYLQDGRPWNQIVGKSTFCFTIMQCKRFMTKKKHCVIHLPKVPVRVHQF